MYMILILIILFIIALFTTISFFKQKKKNDNLKNLQDEQLRQRFKDEFQNEIAEKEKFIQLEDQRLQERKRENQQLEIQKNQIQREIDEKKNFNNSLFKMREDELDRLIAEKRKEKEQALSSLLQKEELEARTKYQQQYVVWLNLQEAEKQKVLEEFEALKEQQNGQLTIYQKEIENIKEELNEFQNKREAVNEAILRERELEEKEDFYRIIISQEDQEDIEVLNTIAPRLRNKEALNKLIYSVFIQRPMDEMIKRVTGGRDVSGIYKITYLKTGEAYIGKTTNIKKRWGEHCKSSLDIGTIAHSSFHTRLKRDGLWNYTFEILEEVPKDKLTEREKFYISLYGTDKQLNMKVG